MDFDVRQSYDEWHRELAASEGDAADLMHPWHRTAARLITRWSSSRILEIGCGRGDFALELARRFPHAIVEAVDFSAAAISIARRRAGTDPSLLGRLSFRVADAQSLPYCDGSFDLVVSCECLEHVPEPDRMTREIHRVLSAGGRFVLTTENYFNGMLLGWLVAWARGEPFGSGSGVQPHENFFVFWKVQSMLNRSGLVLDHTESNHFQWLLLPRTDPAKLCTEDFSNPALKRLFRPFGRHYSFAGHRPS